MNENTDSAQYLKSSSGDSRLKLPDVASEAIVTQNGILDSVGMSGVEVPILIEDSKGQILRQAARIDAYVNLVRPESRGIHMSRLYRDAVAGLSSQALNLSVLDQVSKSFLKTHEGLSNQAQLAVHFDALIERPSLKSSLHGWRSYPVILKAQHQALDVPTVYFVQVLVTYSSTCPASAALARQLVQENFARNFTEPSLKTDDLYHWLASPKSINATPHAQRSYAKVCVQVQSPNFNFVELIDLVENSLQTPVQAMVKREDEQEFALRNGQNLMFCEDAARRVQNQLEARPEITAYQAEFRHQESLHPHDAVSRISKNQLRFID